MLIEIIETRTIKHTVEVGERWPIETQSNRCLAEKHLSEAIDDIGLESIRILKSEKLDHDVVVGGKEKAA